ncbi:hypothetical protein Btru_041491 [Bulinus truncatus]|nr:hypothetical protein Btru_041491 [Bulinus truncatus]
MSDRTLTRTTDFKKKFGEDANDFVGSYSIREIKSLNAGSWFLKSDLCKFEDHHSVTDKMDINETKVPSWDEFLDFISQHLDIKVFIKFSLQDPYHIVIKQISEHPSINIANFYFPLTSVHPEVANSYIEDSRRPSEVNPLIHFDTIFLPLDMFIDVTVQEYQHLNIKSVMMDVNSKWLLTLAWRIGADYVATYYVHLLVDMNFPLYILDNAVYLTIWLTLDTISIFITTVCFISQSATIQEVNVWGSMY